MTDVPRPSLATLAVWGGELDKSFWERATQLPLVQSASFGYHDLDDWMDVALGRTPGHIYSRNTNPTVAVFEEKVRLLEGAEAATSFATGMAAVSNTLFALLASGQRVVSIRDTYGGTSKLFTDFLPKQGVTATLCPTGDHDTLEQEIARGCAMVYVESPTNPTIRVHDIARLARAAHAAGALLVVDNTTATPINTQPLAIGADLVLHSATKFLGGHEDAMGGVVCGPAALIQRIYHYREITGASLAPLHAWLLVRGLKTLALRVRQQNESALAVAQFLSTHPAVASVGYPGLPDDPGHEIASHGYGHEIITRSRDFIEGKGFRVIYGDTDSLFVLLGPGYDEERARTTGESLAAALNAWWAEDLRTKINQLEAAQAGLAEKERMSHEMELARQVQQSVLPQSFPQVAGFGFAARYEAARQVGGDFYDVIDLDENHFGIAVADVSDKGMPAALYMALTRSLRVSQARRQSSPAQVLREVNQLLLELSTSDMFVTIFYGIINKKTLNLRYARAGHDRPFLLHQGQGIDLLGEGSALGVVGSEFLALEEQQLGLVPGDRLVLITDGLTDATAPDQEFFGRARLNSLLCATQHQPTAEVCQAVFSVLRSYQRESEQFDDMTLLVVDIL